MSEPESQPMTVVITDDDGRVLGESVVFTAEQLAELFAQWKITGTGGGGGSGRKGPAAAVRA